VHKVVVRIPKSQVLLPSSEKEREVFEETGEESGVRGAGLVARGLAGSVL
jgi:hypothetical protein